MSQESPGDPSFNKGLEPLKDTPIAPAHGIAAIALNMAIRYHDISTIKDGTLYQQYKLEGRNFRELHLDMVFETAIKMEAHLLGASERIAKLVVDAITTPTDDEQLQSGEIGGM
jgi:hypothetical protein